MSEEREIREENRTGRLLEIVYPEVTNSQGTLFGGHALSLMDRLAFIVASRYTRRPVVTACSEKIEFRAPVKLGELIELTGTVAHVGRPGPLKGTGSKAIQTGCPSPTGTWSESKPTGKPWVN